MGTGEILKLIIDDRIRDGSLKFGWNYDIMNYEFIGFRKNDSIYDIDTDRIADEFVCTCEYVENIPGNGKPLLSKKMKKYVNVTQHQVNEKIEFLRDDKIKTILDE